MSLDNIYIALVAKKAENIILSVGFKNVLSLANTLSKGVKKSKKSLIFKACYQALKKLDMCYLASNPLNNSKWIEVTRSEVKSVINDGVFYTVFSIVNGINFIPRSKRYIVMRYSEQELSLLSEKYNFNILLVGG
jgi:hypothetical protein